MTSALRRRSCTPARDTLAWTFCTVAGATEVVLVAVIIGLITKSSSRHSWLIAIAWTAAVAHVLALLILPVTAFVCLRRTARLTQTVLGMISILLTTLAIVLSIYVVDEFWQSLHDGDKSDPNQDTIETLSEAGFALWAVTLATHITLYTTIFWPAHNPEAGPSSTEQETPRESPARSIRKSITVQLAALSPPTTPRFRSNTEPHTPTYCPSTASSIRSSLDHAIRPMTSRTKLILQKARDSYSLHSERKTSLDTIGQEDDFGDWDTTAPHEVPVEIDSRPSVRSRLETIPGSRPVSPAKPLEGPFPGEQDEISAAESSYHEQLNSPTIHSPSSETSSVRYSVRSLQNDADQSHIHPLFRSESPSPAPAVSARTNILGSPIGGQRLPLDQDFFASRKLSSAQGYRPESPSPLSPASRSRQSSFRSVRYPTPTPYEPFHLERPSPAVLASSEGPS